MLPERGGLGLRRRVAKASTSWKLRLPGSSSKPRLCRSAKRFFQRPAGDQRMAVGRLVAQAGRGVALRIEIDQQGAAAGLGQADGQIHGRGRFADAAFLIGDAQDAAHVMAQGLEATMWLRGDDAT